MSIASEITRLQTAKSDLKTSIENKGVTVPSATTIDGYASLVDQISTGATLQSKSVTPTESAQTVSPDVGYDGLSSVSVGAISSTYIGSGVTQKSAQTYTPTTSTQTIASGQYLTGAQTISPIPPEYIIPSGSISITSNGTVDVTSYTSAIVNVSGGGGSGLEYETGTWTPTADIAKGTITFSNTHTKAPAYYTIADVTGNLNVASQSNLVNGFCDVYRLWGVGFFYSSTEYRYAVVNVSYKGNSSTTNSTILCSHNSDDTGSSSTTYSRYWATSTEFHPYTNSTSRYWRAGRTYKWIAIWV